MNQKLPRKGCKDVFNAFMVDGCYFKGDSEMPLLPSSTPKLPEKMITYPEAQKAWKKYKQPIDAYLCFYTDDEKYLSPKQGIWYHPKKWLPLLKACKGVILPNFIGTLPMHPIERKFYTYQSLALGCYLTRQNIPIIPDFTILTDDRLSYCCDGIPNHSLISIDTSYLINEDSIAVVKQSLELLLLKKTIQGIIFYGRYVPSSIIEVVITQDITYQIYPLTSSLTPRMYPGPEQVNYTENLGY